MNGSRVLAVDGDPSILKIIELTLRDQDIELLYAQTGEEALSIIEQEKPDAIPLSEDG